MYCAGRWFARLISGAIGPVVRTPRSATHIALNGLLSAAFANPLKALWVSLRGIKTTGPMAPEIDLSKQRPAQYIFSAEVQKRLSEIRRDEALAAQQKASTAA